MGIIYIIRNSDNTQLYIGQTTWSLITRWYSHKKCARMVLKSQNGEPLKVKYRGIENSKLYHAMANIGIDKFTIEILEEINDDSQLNAREIEHISNLNTRYPNGYNMTTGGGSKYNHLPESIEKMKEIKRENINNNRNEVLHDMPPYFTYDTQLNAILLQKHPLCAFKGFYITRTYKTIDDAKEAAKEFVKTLEANNVSYTKPKLLISPVKGVYQLPKGSGKYYVNKKIAGVTYRKSFGDGTPEDNMQQAIEYVNKLSN